MEKSVSAPLSWNSASTSSGTRRGQICERILGEALGALLDLRRVPGSSCPRALVEPQRAVLEAALHVALLGEGVVGVLRVVAGQGEVAERVQVLLLDFLPVLAESVPPACERFSFCGRMCSIV